MTKRDQPTVLGGPHVDPTLSGNPAAQRYAKAAQARHPGIPKYTAPVGGGPTPPIPRLDQPHREGMTMADQATEAMFPGGPAPQKQPEGSGGFFAPPVGAQMHRTTGPNLLPSDLLPEAAVQDPLFQQGAGSRYAVNQPMLAMKYGVLRNGQPIAPQQLQTGRPGLRPETIEGLKQHQAMQQKLTETAEARAAREDAGSDARAERDASSGPAGAAARLAGAAGDENIQPVTEADRSRIKKSIEKMDDFDFNTFREMMVKDILNNEDQRSIVEDRCESMDVTDLILYGRVKQVVPIIPGKFEPEFQSLSAEEDLALKRLIMVESKSLNLSERYLLDKYSLMGVAAAVSAVNKKPLPDHLDKDGQFNDELFMKKFNIVVKWPFHMLSSLGINFFWFDVRVRKLFQAEKVKNG